MNEYNTDISKYLYNEYVKNKSFVSDEDKEVVIHIKNLINNNPGYHSRIIKNKFKLNNKILHKISNSVIIVTDLLNDINDILHSGFTITEKSPFDYFVSLYPEINKYENVLYNEIDSRNKLLNLIERVNRSEKKYLVGIGGGRTIDLLKFVGFKTKKEMIVIPSSLATHVYASPKIHCLKPIRECGYKLTIDGAMPELAILDFSILNKMHNDNLHLIYAGFGDIMAFMNSKYDWQLACKKGYEKYSNISDKCIEKVKEILFLVDVKKPFIEWLDQYVFIQVLLCYITDWSGSATASGAEHLFAKCIETEVSEPPLHGEAVALGTLIFTYIRNNDYKEIIYLINKFNIPLSIKSLGMNKQGIIKALSNSLDEGLRKKRYTILNDLQPKTLFFDNLMNNLLKDDILFE